MSKRAWSKIIWERVWTLEDADWKASNVIFRENNLLALTVGKTRYMTWWRISDLDYSLIKLCETMAKIVCHASNLKRDDYRLKGSAMSSRTCIMCDMYCIEDILHWINQCPYYEEERARMYEEIHKYIKEIYNKCPNARKTFGENRGETPYFLLGRRIPFWEEEELLLLWNISGNAICGKYNKAIYYRTGVG